MKKMCMLCAVVCAGVGLVAGARADVVAKVDFAKEAGVVRPALHSSGWSPRVYPRTISNDDAACYTLAVLTKFQFSALDQAYFYGCSHTGNWGYLNEDKSFNKPYQALVAFGSLITDCPKLYSAESSVKQMTVLAAGSTDGKRKSLLVTDYCGTARELSLAVAGVDSSACVSVKRLDHGHEGWEATDCRWQDGRLMLKKDAEGSAAFLVTFGEDVNR